MRKPQWIFFVSSVLIVLSLYAATQSKIFGIVQSKQVPGNRPSQAASLFTIDSILFTAKQELTQPQILRLSQLENGISRGDVAAQKLHAYHQLANFWKDTARLLAPFAWYTAEAARLENSEKSLTFAARLFLEGLKNEQNTQLKQWEAGQAKDLFERSLKLNPANDSSKVNLGEVYLYGGLGSPMEGIGLIRGVVEKDSTNVHAQMRLAEASLVSGQLEKALERFKIVARLRPANLEAIFGAADVSERMENKKAAAEWYNKSLPLISDPALKKEVEQRLSQLRN